MNSRKHALLILAILSLPFSLKTAFSNDQINSDNKKLIIQITLDQFKADYLKWYGAAFKSGFKRVIENGEIISEGLVDHAITNSYPGHVSLSTGMFPSHHGLPANEWWVKKSDGWGWIDGFEDPQTQIVGLNDLPGASPKYLEVTTIADWVKMIDPNSKAITLSSGTMISAAYSGKTADAIYWLNSPNGKFVTSSYYLETYPQWIIDFNENTLNDFKLKTWENRTPEEFRLLAEPDASSYEKFGENYLFPHIFEKEKQNDPDATEEELYNNWFYNTPMADEALFSLAESTILNESLGEDNIVDYLAIIVNSTDNIGHDYGGRSQEILDALLRIDQALGNFLNFLDSTIGKDSYILAISGDHGGPDVIEYQQKRFGTGIRISQKQIDALLDAVENEAVRNNKTGDELISAIEKIIESYDFVYDAITQQEINGEKQTQNPYIDAFRRSWVEGRIADFPLWGTKPREHHPARYGIFVQFKEDTIFHAAPVVHGSVYSYDRKIPIMFYGTNINKIASSGRTVDVAPTLAEIANIKTPSNLDGRSLIN